MYNSTPVKRQHHRPPPGQSSAIAIEHLHHWHAKHIYICQHFGLHIISKGHLWRKGEDTDLIVKVGVLEVRLHVGDPQPSLCCKHHTISRLGSLRFQCCCEGTFGTFSTSDTCSSSRQNWTSKGNNVKFMLHVTVGCWVLSSC